MKRHSVWGACSKGVCQTTALILIAAIGSPQVAARPTYRIDGIVAPQVDPNPLADHLKAELKNLREQLEARSQPVSLNQALEAGLLNNPQLAAAYAQIQGKQWNLVAVRREWYPDLTARSSPNLLGQQATTNTNKAKEGDAPKTTTSDSITRVGARLNLNWTFFDPTRGPRINAAGENVRQQQLLFDVSARNLVLEIQQAYFRLQEDQQLIKAYEEILAGTTRQVQLTEAQFNNGLVSIADVEQIRTQQLSTLGTLIDSYRKLFDAAARLGEVMALEPGFLALASETLSPLGQWDEPLQATIDQALILREEIQASLAAAASANWRATVLFNQYWPQFSLEVGGGYVGTEGKRTNTNNWDASIGISFSWKIFDGGISAAEAEAQRVAALQANDQAAERRLNISREVEQSYANYLTSLLAMQSSQAQSLSARKAATAVQERFAVGVTDMSDVVQTLNQAIGAANAYSEAILSYNTAVASLYRNSARWPAGTEALLNQRRSSLRER
jgi:outer membrane protein TolC